LPSEQSLTFIILSIIPLHLIYFINYAALAFISQEWRALSLGRLHSEGQLKCHPQACLATIHLPQLIGRSIANNRPQLQGLWQLAKHSTIGNKLDFVNSIGYSRIATVHRHVVADLDLHSNRVPISHPQR
jgi:hypothetical protein